MSQMKQYIFDKSTIYQIFGLARHSTNKYLFTIKSIMGLMEGRG